MVAVVVLPYVSDGGESRRGRRGEDGGDRVSLGWLENLLLNVAFHLGTVEDRTKTSSIHFRRYLTGKARFVQGGITTRWQHFDKSGVGTTEKNEMFPDFRLRLSDSFPSYFMDFSFLKLKTGFKSYL